MTRVKICGITSIEDALAAIKYGADALGFIGVRESSRFVTPDQFSAIAGALPLFVNTVIVVNQPKDATPYSADMIQYYNDSETDGALPQKPLIRAFRVKDDSTIEELRSYTNPVRAILLDAFSPAALGGNGLTFPWDLAIRAHSITPHPMILSGGLTPDNVKFAISSVRPYAVDLSSGVESSPGIKDPAKLKAFISAVRSWDLKHP